MGCAGSKGGSANPPKAKDKTEGDESKAPEEQPVSNFKNIG